MIFTSKRGKGQSTTAFICVGYPASIFTITVIQSGIKIKITASSNWRMCDFTRKSQTANHKTAICKTGYPECSSQIGPLRWAHCILVTRKILQIFFLENILVYLHFLVISQQWNIWTFEICPRTDWYYKFNDTIADGWRPKKTWQKQPWYWPRFPSVFTF